MEDDESVILLLQRAAHAVTGELSEPFGRTRLRPADLNVLANLAPGQTLVELARATGTRPSTLTGVVDRLEERGLAVRSADPADRRVVRVAPTRTGSALARRVRQRIAGLEQAALDGIDARTIRCARTVLLALDGSHR